MYIKKNIKPKSKRLKIIFGIHKALKNQCAHNNTEDALEVHGTANF